MSTLLVPCRFLLFWVWYIGMTIYPFIRLMWWCYVAVFTFGSVAWLLVSILAPETPQLTDLLLLVGVNAAMAIGIELFFMCYPMFFEKDMQRFGNMNKDGSKFMHRA